jgi:methylation protein EvaC
VNAEHQTTHGGSMRYTIGRQGEHGITDNVKYYIEREIKQGLNNSKKMKEFGVKIENSKTELKALLSQIKSEGHHICGYAATSKSTTILNYCDIDSSIIDCIFDTTPIKQGKYSPGMHIPILPWEKFSRENYEYTFLFAWNHISEIMKKESDYTSSGRKWITHVPTVQVL